MASWMWLRTQVRTVMDVVRRIEETLERSDAESRRQTKGDDEEEDDVGCRRRAGNAPAKRCADEELRERLTRPTPTSRRTYVPTTWKTF